MNDLISRQAAIDEIKAVYEWHDTVTEDRLIEHIKGLPSAQPEVTLESAIDYLHSIGWMQSHDRILTESAQPEQHWISCSERLPEKGNEVLVCYDFKGHRSVLIGTLYGDGKFYGYDDEYLTPEGRKYRKAVAWMPLPEPYQEEGEQSDAEAQN